MRADGLWSIGELAERAGVTVKTVRFYSERGLLPEAVRSAGGHRRYGPEALGRLRLIRSLRALDLPVGEVARIVAAQDAREAEDAGDAGDGRTGATGAGAEEALDEALGRGLRRVEGELAALRWREASLRLLAGSAGRERAELLRLLGGLGAPPDTGALVRFWRGVLPVRLPGPLVSRVLDAAVPAVPAAPGPAQVLAFARLRALVTDPRLDRVPGLRPGPPLPGETYRAAVLYEGLEEAYGLAAARVRAGGRPEDGGALECFAAAHAAALGTRDGPEFRRRLAGLLAREDGRVMSRYWKLVVPLLPADEPPLGQLHHRLCLALAEAAAP